MDVVYLLMRKPLVMDVVHLVMRKPLVTDVVYLPGAKMVSEDFSFPQCILNITVQDQDATQGNLH